MSSFGAAQRSTNKSVQAFSVVMLNGNATNTATITAVDTTKSYLTGVTVGNGGAATVDSAGSTAVLTNATTVTVARASTVQGITITGFVVEGW